MRIARKIGVVYIVGMSRQKRAHAGRSFCYETLRRAFMFGSNTQNICTVCDLPMRERILSTLISWR